MNILPVDLNEMEYCNFDGLEVDFLQLNGNEIWSVTDELILSVYSVKFSDTDTAGNLITDKYYLVFYINAIEDTTVSFNDFTTIVLAGEKQEIYACNAEDTIKGGDLIITGKCEFSSTYIDYNTDENERFIPMELNGISKWNKKLDYIPNRAFCYVIGVDTNVVVPNNIKTINILAFGGETRVTLGSTTSVKTYSPFSNVIILLPDSLESYYYNSFGNTFNTTYSNGMRFIDGYCIDGKDVPNECIVPDGTRGFPTFTTATYNNEFVWPTTMTKIILNSDGALKTIQKSAFNYTNLALTEIEIPSSVIKLCDNALGASKLTKYLFHTLPNANIEFGASVFGGSSKTAKSITVFTDNEIVKNYALNAENIKAEVWPTYMYNWETLSTPSASINGTILTITPVENASQYVIYLGSTELLRTSETTIDLFQYATTTEQTIYVQAITDYGYFPSAKSTGIILIKKLRTPIATIDGLIATIEPVEYADTYKIAIPTELGSSTIYLTSTLTSLTFDVSRYCSSSETVARITAEDSNGEYASSNYAEITLPGLPKLAQPTTTLEANILTITPVENATSYHIKITNNYGATVAEFNTTELVIDLSSYVSSVELSVGVRAEASGYSPSLSSLTTLPAQEETT